MNNTYSIKKQVDSSMIDYNNVMRFDNALLEFQNLAIFHSQEMGVGFEDLKKSSNAFWVLTKVKLYTPKMPCLTENTTFTTYPTDISPLRFNREFTALGENGGKILGHSEWCVLDFDTKQLRRSNSIKYPTELVHRTDNVGLTFNNARYDVSSEDFAYTYKVKLTDIDCNRHTNNVAYARMALNAFNLDEYDNYNFNTFEIRFIAQSYYASEIEIYKKVVDENTVFVLGKSQDKNIFSVIFSNN